MVGLKYIQRNSSSKLSLEGNLRSNWTEVIFDSVELAKQEWGQPPCEGRFVASTIPSLEFAQISKKFKVWKHLMQILSASLRILNYQNSSLSYFIFKPNPSATKWKDGVIRNIVWATLGPNFLDWIITKEKNDNFIIFLPMQFIDLTIFFNLVYKDTQIRLHTPCMSIT